MPDPAPSAALNNGHPAWALVEAKRALFTALSDAVWGTPEHR